MSLIDLFKKRLVADKALTGGGYSFFFSATTSGRPVTECSAMQMTVVYSCVHILAEAIAGLPLHVYRQEADGAKGRSSTIRFIGWCMMSRIRK